ncbi:MAG TPA: AbrB/MazE/SpoVT family DNA-binding domain-containing protein [Pseudolabrys sp.]|jgi:antitoxin MazE
MKVKVAKWGNSLGVRLPKAAAEAAGLKPGSELDVTVEGSDLRLRKTLRIPYYRLEDLVAQMVPGNEPELVDWGPDRGDEIIDDAYSRGEITLADILKRKKTSKSVNTRRPGKSNEPAKRRRHRLG